MAAIRNDADFDGVFRRLYPPLLRYVHRLTGDPDLADDIVQEAFIRLLRDPLPEEDARPWLFRVATNLVRDRARTAKRRKRLLDRSVAPAGRAESRNGAERMARIAEVRSTLARLSERDRTMLLMREEGFKYDEIAEAVGVAPGSVGTLLARALRRFRDAYAATETIDATHS